MEYQDTSVRSASHLNIDTLKIFGKKKLQKDKHVHNFNMSSGINRPAKEREETPNTGK